MTPITREIVTAITNKAIEEVLVDPPIEPKMTENKRKSFQAQAKRILQSELYQYCLKVIVNGTAQKIIRNADSDLLRGKVIGVAELNAMLTQWMAEVRNGEEVSYTEGINELNGRK